MRSLKILLFICLSTNLIFFSGCSETDDPMDDMPMDDMPMEDDNSELKKLTGELSKIWKLSRDVDNMVYPIQVGPNDRSQIWWALGVNEDIGNRPCLMEEEYIFSLDGTYTYNTKGLVYADEGVWNTDAAKMCIDESDATLMTGPNGEDLSAFGSGSFTFNYDPDAGTLTINGLGGHVGLAKVGTNAEHTTPQSSVTYDVISIETDGPIDKLQLETSLDAAGGYWQFNLVSYDDPSQEPDLPGVQPVASFTYEADGAEVTFTNNSTDADSYVWDFGDGTTSTMENPSHTYVEDGSYTVTLMATNANGTATTSQNVVIAISSTFTASSLHGDDTKSWKLYPMPASLAVGPAKGSGEWFANSAEDVTTRACTFDDTYSFSSTGVFEYASNGDLWGEPYMGIDPPGCAMEDALANDAVAWGSGVHAFSVTEADGDTPAMLTVTGTGAFIGLPKVFNGGEYESGPPVENGSVTFEVLSYINTADEELLILTIDISENEVGGSYWTFTLVAE